MNENSQWFEKEDFWTKYAPIMFDDVRWIEAPSIAQRIKEIAGLKKASSVLDCGCGLGRISVELAALDLNVTGIDIIQTELDAAKESAEAEGVELELINADLRNFKTDKKYDCSINIFTSFGYCDTIEEDMEILKNMCNPIKKNGYFIMESLSLETAVMYFTEGEVFDRAGYTVKTEYAVEGAWEGLRSRWTLYPQTKTQSKGTETIDFTSIKPVADHVFTQRLYPASFLRDKLFELGFTEVQIYGDFDQSPYDQNAKTMVIIAKK